MPTIKYIQTLRESIFTELTRIAQQKGISVQELIRAVIIPDWIRIQEKENSVILSLDSRGRLLELDMPERAALSIGNNAS